MKGAVFERFGDPAVLALAEVEPPAPKQGHLLVDVHYAGVNPVDWKIRRGYFKDMMPHEFPIVSGFDFAGVVSNVGAGIDGFAPGDRVFSINLVDTVRYGSYAETTIVPAAITARVPESLSLRDAAALPMVSLTAWQSLFDFGHLSEGATVLVQAGAGGIGSMAIQFAKHVGATVYTTCRSANADYVRGLGADHVIDYTESDFVEAIRQEEPEGVDLVVTLGGDMGRRGYDALKQGGRLANLDDPVDEAEGKSRGVEAQYIFVRADSAQLEHIAGLVVNGEIALPAVTELPLSQAAEAHAQSETGHVRGKIVLAVR